MQPVFTSRKLKQDLSLCEPNHNTDVPKNFLARFNVIKKCTNKFDCLVNEALYSRS